MAYVRLPWEEEEEEQKTNITCVWRHKHTTKLKNTVNGFILSACWSTGLEIILNVIRLDKFDSPYLAQSNDLKLFKCENVEIDKESSTQRVNLMGPM